MDVPARTLDVFVLGQDIVEIDLLKIDVQGTESAVLRGSQSLLGRCQAILVEVSLYDYYAHVNSIGEVER